MVTLTPYQESAKAKLIANTIDLAYHASQLQAKVGLGKTYIVLGALQELLARKWFDGHTCIFPAIYVTKATAVDQTMEVAYDEFGINPKDLYITNYDQFRATFGEIFLTEKTIIKNGEPEIIYTWKPMFAPKLFLLDECQALMNDSTQAKIFLEASRLTSAYFWHISATPFVRVSGAKVFCCHSKIPYDFGYDKGSPLTPERWPYFAKDVCLGSSPEDYNKEAVKRLMEKIKPYIIRVPSISTKFKTHNSVGFIDLSHEEMMQYNAAMRIFLEACAKILETGEPNYAMAILVELLKFRQASEKLKAPYYADAAADSIKAGKAPIIAVAFKQTLAIVVKTLIEKHGLSREDISVIWGGASKPSEKATAAAKVAWAEMEQMVDDYDLGSQNHKERWKNVKAFQTGKSKVCVFTFKSGGVALSLHHHKNDGSQLPRETFSSLTYSVIELVQAFGRAHRMNSISDTYQQVICARNTIEELHVAPKLIKKIECLGEVTAIRESWASTLVKGALETEATSVKETLAEQLLDVVKQDEEQKLLEDRKQSEDNEGDYEKDSLATGDVDDNNGNETTAMEDPDDKIQDGKEAIQDEKDLHLEEVSFMQRLEARISNHLSRYQITNKNTFLYFDDGTEMTITPIDGECGKFFVEGYQNAYVLKDWQQEVSKEELSCVGNLLREKRSLRF